MVDQGQQLTYWNAEGATKTFSHPLDCSWLGELDRRDLVLDYGCGYGRLTSELLASGFENVAGVDISATLVDRARREHPGARYTVLDSPPCLHHDDRSVDAVLLFAVLTCLPADADQQSLATELQRVLRPGGLLYLSDYCLQDDARNQVRYRRYAGKYGLHGVFEAGDGAVFRHHTREWLESLFEGFSLRTGRTVPSHTLNGHPAEVTQLLLQAR
jgi:SAM-dependent methyltransferase